MYLISIDPKVVKAMAANVVRGVKFLRKAKGPQWWKMINIKTLDLADTTMCVLGQTFRGEVESDG